MTSIPRRWRRYDALLIYANIDPDQSRPGEGPARLRRRGRRVRAAPLRVVLLPQFAQVHRARRRPVPAPRHGRVRHQDRRPVASDHEGLRAVPHLGRDLRAHKHNEKDRHVLQVRAEGTWRRALDLGADPGQGAGLLHGLRPRRPDLAEPRLPRPDRARHSLGGRTRARSSTAAARVKAGLPPFSYEESTVDIPNYLPARQWGTQGEPIRRMQKPLISPEESMRHLVVPPGFEPRLFAAEPEIYKPLCMAWDHRGRLWIAESVDYPNTKNRGRHRAATGSPSARIPTATAGPTRSRSSPRA